MARDRERNRQESSAIEPRQGGGISRPESWPTFHPFGLMRRFADEMDRMFDNFGFSRFGAMSPWRGERFLPEMDMFERDGKLVIRAELPGLTKDEVTVDVAEGSIVIKGERKYEHDKHEEGIYRSERSYGQFYREVPLPKGVKAESATGTFKNGVLEIAFEAPDVSKKHRRV